MVKLKLTTLEGIAEAFKTEYKLQADGTYLLELDTPVEDVTGLKNALSAEKQEKANAKARVTALESEVGALNLRVGPAGDLEKSWQAKFDKAVSDGKGSVDKVKKQLKTIMVDRVALEIAAEISTAPSLLLPVLKSRLRMEEGDDEVPITRVLTADGKTSALSVNELKAEILANQEFAPILRASSASGGGANGNIQRPAGGSKQYRDMNEGERVALYRANKPEFDKQHKAWLEAGKPAPTKA